eukprot:2814412-Rhodomonas_salina.1
MIITAPPAPTTPKKKKKKKGDLSVGGGEGREHVTLSEHGLLCGLLCRLRALPRCRAARRDGHVSSLRLLAKRPHVLRLLRPPSMRVRVERGRQPERARKRERGKHERQRREQREESREKGEESESERARERGSEGKGPGGQVWQGEPLAPPPTPPAPPAPPHHPPTPLLSTAHLLLTLVPPPCTPRSIAHHRHPISPPAVPPSASARAGGG